jgi:hypothetical protein
MRWVGGRLLHLSASGSCSDLSLEALSDLWGAGRITGTAEVEIRSLLIVDEELRLADVEINAVPPKTGQALIDRSIIARFIGQKYGIDVGAALPDHIEYKQLGARLILKDGQLRILGTHGRGGRTILTVEVLGQPLGVIKAPQAPIPVPDALTGLWKRAADTTPGQIRTWWENLPPANEDKTP